MSKRRPAWDNYKEKVAKRMRKGEEKAATGPKGGLTIQRLSANVESKCQKYLCIGPLTLVPCEKELTLENIMANVVLPLPSQDKSRTGKFCMCASWKFSNTNNEQTVNTPQ